MADSENIQFVLRPSWAYFINVYIVGLIVFAVSAAANSVELMVIAILATPIVAYILRLRHLFTITNQRIIARSGIIARDTQELALHHIRAINVHQNIANRILRIGHIEITSAADERGVIIIEGIGDPVGVKELIWHSLNDKKDKS